MIKLAKLDVESVGTVHVPLLADIYARDGPPRGPRITSQVTWSSRVHSKQKMPSVVVGGRGWYRKTGSYAAKQRQRTPEKMHALPVQKKITKAVITKKKKRKNKKYDQEFLRWFIGTKTYAQLKEANEQPSVIMRVMKARFKLWDGRCSRFQGPSNKILCPEANA